MTAASRDFQVFAKPVGAACNLACRYCYYLPKKDMPGPARMTEEVLETYIARQIEASPGDIVRFSWHGGEPTLYGLETFRRIVALQKKHAAGGRKIVNGIQTNGTLLDEAWCRFLAEKGFRVGLSLDGPREIHDLHRVTSDGGPTFDKVLGAFDLLQLFGVPIDILCVVHQGNADRPLEVYRFFKRLGAERIGFLPLVIRDHGGTGVLAPSVRAEAFGEFLCAVFDEWKKEDVGRIGVEMIDEAARTAYGELPAVCVFRPVCGDVPVVERDGSFYACDHYVDEAHRYGNILDAPLAELVDGPAQRAFGMAKADLPLICRQCPVLSMCNGGCPKDRFIPAPEGGPDRNYLCPGYKRFFTHVKPFVDQLANLRRTREAEGPAKPGRNDPCPCGSGRKYKKCCGQ